MKTNRPLSTDLTQLMPQAPDMEQAVLGALLIEPTAFGTVEELLHPDDFYLPAHQLIYQAMIHLTGRRIPMDLLTVMQELTRMKELDQVGGPLYLSELSSGVASSSHIEYHARVILDRSVARKVIRIATETAGRAYDPGEDISEVVEWFEKQLTGLVVQGGNPLSVSMPDALKKATAHAAHMQQLYESGEETAIPTGLTQLDKATDGGWRAPDLIIAGGRPSMGKTQLALSFARVAASRGKHVLFVSIEMGEIALVNRLILEDERIPSAHLRNGRLTPEEWAAMDRQVATLWDLHLHIAARPEIRYLHNIRSEARRLKRQQQLDMIVIDYLGLIRTRQTFDRRHHEIGYITSELKQLAKELEVPVILLSQLNRPIKGMKVHEPVMEDLRESGDIEQDADIIILLHRPSYYQPDVVDSRGVPWTGRGKLIIAKCREGVRNTQVIFYHDHHFKKIAEHPFGEVKS